MVLELHIAGPGLDLVRRIEAGQEPVVIGRGQECTVCLPDPERNVSRRHLSVWNEGGVLRFHVLSAVNGVDLPAGEVPPGERGQLAPGEALMVAAYRLTVQPAAQDDPWAVFDTEEAGMTTLPADLPSTLPAGRAQALAEADPFGDWGFQTTFGASVPGTGGLQAGGLAVARDLAAFFRGLGLEPAQMRPLTEGELEAIGRMVRDALLGLLELHASAEATAMAPKSTNPLKDAHRSPEAALGYLFGGRAAAAGSVGAERAVRELVADLLAHGCAPRPR